jgi:hypothetical protein
MVGLYPELGLKLSPGYNGVKMALASSSKRGCSLWTTFFNDAKNRWIQVLSNRPGASVITVCSLLHGYRTGAGH